MKKHVIAAAVATAIAAPAIAQNVQIYGAVDQGLQNYDSGNVSLTRAAAGILNTNRIGFTGSEDLGGGLKAEFQLQQAFSDSVGAFSTGTSEESWVGLSGSFGQIRIGTTDMSGLQGIDSAVSGAGNLANSPSTGSALTTLFSGEDGADMANTVRYISPTVNGFQLDVGYSSGNASTAVADGNVAETSVMVSYKSGPLAVYAGQHEVDGVGVAKKDYKALGARYDFGVAAVGAIVSKGDPDSGSDSLNRSNSVVTVNVPLGNGLTAHASKMSAKISDTSYKSSGVMVALTKAMSKRTTAYAAYTSVTNEAGTVTTWGGVTSAAVGLDPKAITVGLSHTF
jgi:general bacterial porin, GBP family